MKICLVLIDTVYYLNGWDGMNVDCKWMEIDRLRIHCKICNVETNYFCLLTKCYLIEKQNKNEQDESLNIPDQQKLLSAYRCEHALNESYKIFTESTGLIVEEVKEKYVEGFGRKLDEIIARCISEYQETANKYDKEEANEKYISLVDKIETQIQYLFSFQYKHLTEKVMDLYEYEMKQALPKGICVDNLEDVVSRVGENVRKFFSNKIEECLINTENKNFLDKDVYWKETQKRLREATKSIQLEEWQLLCKENENLADEHLLTQISRLLRKPSEKIWNQISSFLFCFSIK